MDLTDIQALVGPWHRLQFGPSVNHLLPAAKVCEEAGELVGATLRNLSGQNIEQHLAQRDAVGDVLIALAAFCDRANIDLDEAFRVTWEEVARRDFRKYPTNGRTK